MNGAGEAQTSGDTTEKGARDELTRVFDTCHGCRQCVDLCDVFPTLFDLLDQRGASDAGFLTPHEQDTLVDQCVLCQHCAAACPFAPERDALSIDVPRAVQRARAMRWARRRGRLRQRWFGALVGRPRRWGRVARLAGPASSRVRRALVARTVGVSAVRPIPTRGRSDLAPPDVPATALDGMHVTFVRPCAAVGDTTSVIADLSSLARSAGSTCAIAEIECCGAASLDVGDLGRFRTLGRRTVGRLGAGSERGAVVVVAPACARVISREYPRYLDGDEVQAVADRVVDPVRWLAELLPGRLVDDDRPHDARSPTGPEFVYVPSGHSLRMDANPSVEDALADLGIRAGMRCVSTGPETIAGFSVDQDDVAAAHAVRLAAALASEADAAVVLTDGQLSSTLVSEVTDRSVEHPVTIIARSWQPGDSDLA